MSGEFDPVVDGVLRRARAAASPSAGELEQALVGIRTRLAAAPVGLHEVPDVAAPDAPAAALNGKSGKWSSCSWPRARWAAELRRLLGIALTLGVGFALGVQYAGRGPSATPAVTVQRSAGLPGSAVAQGSVQAGSAPQPTAPPAAAPHAVSAAPAAPSAAELALQTRSPAPAPSSTQLSGRAKQRAPARAVRRSQRPAKSTREPELLTFAQVLERLERAQRAERALEPEVALALLDELDARADTLTLREERLVTRVLAACDVGDPTAAERAALELGSAAPASVYTSRIASSCAAPTPSSAPAPPGAR